jgi:quercetin dioxygenase-like cupin family protein
MNPYKDSSNIRSFSKNVKKLELVWHKDDEDRDIEILEGKGWQMQFDDELPFDLVKGDHIFIKRHRIHRILKGTTDLKIKING